MRSTHFIPAALCCAAFAVAGFLASTATPAAAATYSVSPDGSDGSTGATEQPFQTIGKAALVARRGDTVLVGSGRYGETVALDSNNSGVTFRGVGGSRPVIDGGGTRDFGLTTRATTDVVIENFEVTSDVVVRKSLTISV